VAKRKKWLLIIITLLVLIQFIRPARNYKSVIAGNTLDRITLVPDSVHELLKHACFDCHSNNTVYPWYANVQPVGWWLANHIKEGKEELNFDEFAGYTSKRQIKKLDEIKRTVHERSMPLSSYTWIHTNARLTTAERDLISGWAAKVKDSLSAANK